MKKYLAFFALPLFMFMFVLTLSGLGSRAAAFDPFHPNGDPNVICDQTDADGQESPVCSAEGDTNPVTGDEGLLNKAANVFAIVTGVAAIIVIMIGGFEYVRSGGESAKVSKAKNSILFAAIGLVIVILARAAVALMITKLG